MKEGLHPSPNRLFLIHVQRMSQVRQAHQHTERSVRTPIIRDSFPNSISGNSQWISVLIRYNSFRWLRMHSRKR